MNKDDMNILAYVENLSYHMPFCKARSFDRWINAYCRITKQEGDIFILSHAALDKMLEFHSNPQGIDDFKRLRSQMLGLHCYRELSADEIRECLKSYSADISDGDTFQSIECIYTIMSTLRDKDDNVILERVIYPKEYREKEKQKIVFSDSEISEIKTIYNKCLSKYPLLTI